LGRWGGVSGGEAGYGLASVFGSEMATYSEAATRADLDDTKNAHIGRGRTGEGEGIGAGEGRHTDLRGEGGAGDGGGRGGGVGGGGGLRAGYGGRWLACGEDARGGGGTVMMWTPSLYP
jgi:hypothetical protein